jgi:hypothetical protein
MTSWPLPIFDRPVILFDQEQSLELFWLPLENKRTYTSWSIKQ